MSSPTPESNDTPTDTSRSERITALSLTDFTVFEQATLKFSPALNVFIGTNGTGKSHVLKILYTLMKGREGHTFETPELGQAKSNLAVREKMAEVFKPEGGKLVRLVRKGAAEQYALVRLEKELGQPYRFSIHGARAVGHAGDTLAESHALFIPSREVLAMYEGFTSAYERRELSFDETYYDLCKELSASPLRNKGETGLTAVLAELEKVLGGTVKLSGNRFYVTSKQGDTEAHLLAEGLRKIAMLAALISNGALNDKTLLFWDEPEANLNPKLVVVVARILRQLAAAGVQTFIATHDYLLVRELSMAVEYQSQPVVETCFFSFYRPAEDAPVQVESGKTLAVLEHNPIMEEFAAHDQREQDLFYAPPRVEGQS